MMNREDLVEAVEMIEVMASMTSRKARMRAVEDLTDEYIAQTGTLPDGGIMQRLTDVILHEELSDPDPHKMTNNEYPIMSEMMYKKRTDPNAKHAPRRKDKLVFREVPLAQARNMGVDGKNYDGDKRRYT